MKKLITLLACVFVFGVANAQQGGFTFLFDGAGLKYGIDTDVKEVWRINPRLSLNFNVVAAKEARDAAAVWTGGGGALRYVVPNSDVTISLLFGGTVNLIERSFADAPALWYVGLGGSWKF